jgi:hypothetical protein
MSRRPADARSSLQNTSHPGEFGVRASFARLRPANSESRFALFRDIRPSNWSADGFGKVDEKLIVAMPSQIFSHHL